ncbi:MAG: ABC transporter ATP-binding protein [Oscillospiraceae bacterium]|nr:ABC transporter ATP-binding protein [Oscillospiraceae bacterium]
MKAVVAENLVKIYPSGKKAVGGVSFSLEQGEVFGFLGPNGSGKTTTVKLLNGMLSPTEGACRVFGVDPSLEPAQMHQFSGVLTEHAQMYDHLTGFQNLVFYGALFGMDAAKGKKRALDLLDRLELADAKDRKLGAYSTGMRQRLSLARAMIHGPKILFLDEPTSGLDPESVMGVNKMIKNLAETEGATVFLCTHQLRYAQEICTSYGLIDEGVLLAAGSIDELRALVFPGMVVNIKTGEKDYEINVQSENEIPAAVKRIVEEGGSVYHVSSHRLSLEEIYFALLEKRRGDV